MNTNCVNCGAALEIDQLRQIKHCPYCGAEVEIKDETPDTMAGTIHGIAKTFFNQTADKIRYNREHAVEIAEQRRKDKAEEARQSRKMMMYMMLVFIGIASFQLPSAIALYWVVTNAFSVIQTLIIRLEIMCLMEILDLWGICQ